MIMMKVAAPRKDDNKKLTNATKLSIEDYNHFVIYTRAAFIEGIIDEPKPSSFLRYIATVLLEGLLDRITSFSPGVETKQN
jgi:hypothetical protein